MDTVILIPAYKPDEALVATVTELSEKGYDILVVDDGSGKDYQRIFRAVVPLATVLRKKENHGKGAALKSGFDYLIKHRPDCRFVITADADGQHKTTDIVRMDAYLHEFGGFVIGSREFVGAVPLRSKFGNSVTREVFALVSGTRVGDTQTGLRGFETALLPWLISVPGERYEYEMNILLDAAARRIPICEIPIETLYEAGNPSSHFDPIKDSIKIYRCIANYLFKR